MKIHCANGKNAKEFGGLEFSIQNSKFNDFLAVRIH
jgi:hypothetical protein